MELVIIETGEIVEAEDILIEEDVYEAYTEWYYALVRRDTVTDFLVISADDYVLYKSYLDMAQFVQTMTYALHIDWCSVGGSFQHLDFFTRMREQVRYINELQRGG